MELGEEAPLQDKDYILNLLRSIVNIHLDYEQTKEAFKNLKILKKRPLHAEKKGKRQKSSNQ